MAKNIENAGVNVYINDTGASNTLKGLSSEVRKLENNLKNLPIGSREYSKSLEELQSKRKVYDDIRRDIRGTEDAMNKMKDSWSKVAIGFGAAMGVIAGAAATFKKVMESTGATADKLKEVITGVEWGISSMFRTIASGDWSNLISNMVTAIEKGKEYAKILDEVEERQLSLSIREKKTRIEIEDLYRVMKDGRNTDKVQAEAALQILNKEKALMQEKQSNARLALEASLLKGETETKLHRGTIQNYLEDRTANSAKIEQAQQYLDVVKELSDWQGKDSRTQAANADRIQQLKATIDGTSGAVKAYSLIVRGVNNMSDQTRKEIVDNWNAVMQTQIDYSEGTKRVFTNYTNNLAAIGKAEKKQADDRKKDLKDVKTAYEELDVQIKEYIALLQIQVTSDPAQAALTAEKIKRLEAEKAKIDELVKSYTELTKQTPFTNAPEGMTMPVAGEMQKEGLAPFGDISEIAPAEGETPVWVEKTNQVIDYATTAANVLMQLDATMASIENAQMAKDTAVNDQKKANLKKQLDAKRISLAQYNTQVEKLDADLAKKQRKVAHDQAVRQKEIAVMNAIINTAAGMTRAFVDPGGIAGIILMALIGIMGAVQIGTILSTPVPQAARGKYTVRGKDDGRTYSDVPYEGHAKTGIYARPTLISEAGPELIVDAPTTRNIQMNYPWLIHAIDYARVPQYSAGRYPESPPMGEASGMAMNVQGGFPFTASIDRLNANLEAGIRARVVWNDIDTANNQMEDIQSDVSRK